MSENMKADIVERLEDTTDKDARSDAQEEITHLRAEVERLTEERQRENWWPPMERVMQRYPGFDWSDYQDGISEDVAVVSGV